MTRRCEVQDRADALLKRLSSKRWHCAHSAHSCAERRGDDHRGETLDEVSGVRPQESRSSRRLRPTAVAHHIFIPLVPEAMLEYLAAPSPYLVGVLRLQIASVRRIALGDAVILFLKTNEIEMTKSNSELLAWGVKTEKSRRSSTPGVVYEKSIPAFQKEIEHIRVNIVKGKLNAPR